jgi:hypothetical protein
MFLTLSKKFLAIHQIYTPLSVYELTWHHTNSYSVLLKLENKFLPVRSWGIISFKKMKVNVSHGKTIHFNAAHYLEKHEKWIVECKWLLLKKLLDKETTYPLMLWTEKILCKVILAFMNKDCWYIDESSHIIATKSNSLQDYIVSVSGKMQVMDQTFYRSRTLTLNLCYISTVNGIKRRRSNRIAKWIDYSFSSRYKTKRIVQNKKWIYGCLFKFKLTRIFLRFIIDWLWNYWWFWVKKSLNECLKSPNSWYPMPLNKLKSFAEISFWYLRFFFLNEYWIKY